MNGNFYFLTQTIPAEGPVYYFCLHQVGPFSISLSSQTAFADTLGVHRLLKLRFPEKKIKYNQNT